MHPEAVLILLNTSQTLLVENIIELLYWYLSAKAHKGIVKH